MESAPQGFSQRPGGTIFLDSKSSTIKIHLSHLPGHKWDRCFLNGIFNLAGSNSPKIASAFFQSAHYQGNAAEFALRNIYSKTFFRELPCSFIRKGALV